MTASAMRDPAARALDRRMPDFFIVGHAKSGTTALYEMLRRHPGCTCPNTKAARARSRGTSRATIRTRRVGRARHLLHRSHRDDLGGISVTVQRGAPGTARRRGLLLVPVVADGGRRIHAADRTPGSSRSFASPRASCAHCICSCCRITTSRSWIPQGGRTWRSERENREIPKRSYWPRALIYCERVRYVEQLQRYRALFGPSRCWC